MRKITFLCDSVNCTESYENDYDKQEGLPKGWGTLSVIVSQQVGHISGIICPKCVHDLFENRIKHSAIKDRII